MGLSNQSGSITYVNMKQGKLAIKESDGSIKLFDSITGVLTGIEFKEDEYNGKHFEKLCLVLEDAEGKYLVQMRLDSGYSRGFLFAIKNADLSQEMTLIPNSKTVNDRPQQTIFLKQGNTSLKWVWTKDNPGDLPQLKSVKVKGETVYDNTEQMAYLKNMLQTEIIPNLGKGPDKTPAPASKEKQTITEPIGDDFGDLPF